MSARNSDSDVVKNIFERITLESMSMSEAKPSLYRARSQGLSIPDFKALIARVAFFFGLKAEGFR
ncbi:MAG: hypothetical protein EPO21_01525 [Chloroflexota bacterium]|nr:MAG: hypothetical protein EPO21_01525 [Chloroflexota bacterium]